MIVVADTSPINYLVLIGHVEILHSIYGEVLIPRAVYDELQDNEAPPEVGAWLFSPPAWLRIITPSISQTHPLICWIAESSMQSCLQSPSRRTGSSSTT